MADIPAPDNSPSVRPSQEEDIYQFIKNQVEQNSGIADQTEVRLNFLENRYLQEAADAAGLTVEEANPILVSAARNETLQRNFNGFFSELDRNKNFQLVDTRNYQGDPDPVFNNPQDNTEQVLLSVLKDPELSRKWLSTVREVVRESSDRNIREIDQNRYIDRELVIVGGGPLTSLAVTVLGPYFDITVITDQRSIGEPGLHRYNYLNSPADTKDINAPRLPLTEGSSTTPVTPTGSINAVDFGPLVNEDALRIICETGDRERTYAPFNAWAKAAVTNMASYVTDYIVEHTVDASRTRRDVNGIKTLVMEGKNSDGKTVTREVDAKYVLFLTGPGIENVTLNDQDGAAQAEYRAALQQINELLESVRDKVATGEKVEPFQIPRVLTPQMKEKLYELWDVDLDADPGLFPFADLFNANRRIAIVGGGDQSKTDEELFKLKGPKESYPPGFTQANIPETVVIGLKPGERRERLRYRQTVAQAKILPQRGAVVVKSNASSEKVVIATQNDDGTNTQAQEFDYIFLNTGLKRSDISRDLGDAGFLISGILDQDGNQVAKGTPDGDLLVLATAANFSGADFPTPIRNILDALGIGENTVSAWANAILTERALWTKAANWDLNTVKLKRLLNNYSKASSYDLVKKKTTRRTSTSRGAKAS